MTVWVVLSHFTDLGHLAAAWFWIDPGCLVSPHTIYHLLPSQLDGRESQGQRCEELKDQDKDIWLIKGKKRKTNKTKHKAKQRQSLTISHKQTDAQPPSEEWLLWDTPSYSGFHSWAWFYMVSNVPLVIWGQLCPLSCVPSQPLAHLFGGEAEQDIEKSLRMCRHCLAIA